MTVKIGRNDPCYCGSGRKFKQCCMGKEARRLPSADLPFPTVAEEFALGPLLTASAPFRAAYAAERPRIGGSLAWTSQVPLPGVITAQALRLPGGQRALYLRRLPAALQDALPVAHELLHLVLDAEGFPLVLAVGENQPLAALLNSLLHDPLIDGRLLGYGFDVGARLQAEVRAGLSHLERAVPPGTPETRRLWVLNYTAQLLAWQALLPRCPDVDAGPLQRWFEAHQPEIASEARAAAAIIARDGYETPERLRAALQQAIRIFRLEQACTLEAPGRAPGSTLARTSV